MSDSKKIKRTHHQMSLLCKAINKANQRERERFRKRVDLRQWLLSGDDFVPQVVTFGKIEHVFVSYD